MLKHKKFEYPAIAELPIEINLDLLKTYLKDHDHLWQDNYSAHEGLCVNNGKVADSTYKQIDHFHLTGTNFDADNAPKTSDFEEYTAKAKIKRDEIHPYMDEYNWAHPLPHYGGTELHKHLTSLFKSPIIRLRMSRMQPGCVVPEHIDYNTTYAVRFIIPISGNGGVVNRFWYKGEIYDFEMQEGKAYFLNVGYKHAVYHKGFDTRYYLLGTLGGQEDIECLRLTPTTGQ